MLGRRFIAIASIVAVAAAAGIAGPGRADGAETIAAPARSVQVIDGDSLQVGRRVLNLAGIDAPELGQLCDADGRAWPCGLDAARRIKKLLALQLGNLLCRIKTSDGMPEAAVCVVADSDLGAIQLTQGLAVATDDAPPTFRAIEDGAREAGLGIWSSRFVQPPSWRRGERLPMERDAVSTTGGWNHFPRTVFGVRLLPIPRTHYAGCVLRGMPAAGGRRVFLGPLDDGYAGIARGRANRAFCSDDEAERAGWLHIGQTAVAEGPRVPGH